MNADSVEKVITRYFACMTTQPFHYKGKSYIPKPLSISPLLLRGYTCPEGCGGCCHIRFSLDYIIGEMVPEYMQPAHKFLREIEFDGRLVPVISDFQTDNKLHQCQHLNSENGRCGVYTRRPFSCDFELIRTLEYKDEQRPSVLTQKLFGRGWNMLRIDGERGALCEMLSPTPDSINEVIRKLRRLEDWAAHFGITTHSPTIRKIITDGRLTKTITLYPKSPSRKGFFNL